MDVSQYAELFLAEAGEYMQVLNQCLLSLESDPNSREELLEAFRVAHSLKGMAGTMGYRHVTDIAHGLENFMEGFKTGEQEPSADLLDILFEAVDLLQLSLEHPEESPPEDVEKWQALQTKMNNFKANAEALPKEEGAEPAGAALAIGAMDAEILRQADQKGQCPSQVTVILKKEALMKSVRVYMIFKILEELCEVVTTLPSMADLEEEKFEQSFHLLLIPHTDKAAEIKEKLMKVSDVEEVKVAPWSADSVLLQASSQDPESASAPPKDKSTALSSEARATEPAAGRVETEDKSLAQAVPKQSQVAKAVDKMVRVETQKLDDLVNLVGEMVVARTRLTEIGRGFSEDLDDSIDQLKRSITNLQDTAMGLRMVPIKQVFERFPRMVRDLGRGKGKKVQLLISGEETELDRSIINRLSDPLVHLLRNAFDHGIETPEERSNKGKNEEGTIYLSACHEGNQVVITVEDDGAGMDPDVIGEIAVKKGAITKAELSQMSKEDKINLIFFNGFSTSSEVTDVSGRGVGMDAVRNSIESLHGTIEVFSEIGVMTRFVLRLPLTLAIIKTLLVESLDQYYAIPVEVIKENVYIDSADIKSIKNSPVINLRGDVIPLYPLSALLGFGNADLNEEECSVVIVEAAGKKAGFVVDDFVGQQEIMIKSLGGFLKGLRGIAGATVLGDGRVTLIIDVAALLSEGRE